MMRWLIVFCVLVSPAAANDGIGPEDVRLELALEQRDATPLVGEMVLLSIRGTYRLPVMLESLVQPDLAGFDWMQLGEDRWFKTQQDGREVLNFERRMALFPQLAGELAIGAFRHELKVLSPRGWPVERGFESGSIALNVDPNPTDAAWWFPVRGIEVTDSWSNQPEALPSGGAALRVVAMTVLGTAPQRIPPMPELTGAGAHIFPHPEHRIVSLGPQGPQTRVFWRWTVRPRQGSAGYLNPIDIDYFDTSAREARSITLSAQRVAYDGGPTTVVETSPSTGPDDGAPADAVRGLTIPGWALPLALLAGALTGLWAVFRRLRQSGVPWRGRTWRDPDLAGLRRAVAGGDRAGVLRLARRLLRGARPAAYRHLERAVYGREAASDVDLEAVRRAVMGYRR